MEIAPNGKDFKILYLSNAPYCPSGYGVISKGLVYDWNKYYNVHMLCNYGIQGGWLKLNGLFHYPILPEDQHGDKTARLIFRNWNPDLFITLYDIFMGAFVEPAQTPEGFAPIHPHWVCYTMVDHYPIPDSTLVQAAQAYKVVAPTRYGQDQFRQNGVACEYIPFGCVSGETEITMAGCELLGLSDSGITQTRVLDTHRIATTLPLLEISTAKRKLRITPDQEILTKTGDKVQWVPSGLLREGNRIGVLKEGLYPSTVPIELLVDRYEKNMDGNRKRTSSNKIQERHDKGDSRRTESFKIVHRTQNHPLRAAKLQAEIQRNSMDGRRRPTFAATLPYCDAERPLETYEWQNPSSNHDEMCPTVLEEDTALCCEIPKAESTKTFRSGMGVYCGDSRWRRDNNDTQMLPRQVLSSPICNKHKHGTPPIFETEIGRYSSEALPHTLLKSNSKLPLDRYWELCLQPSGVSPTLLNCKETSGADSSRVWNKSFFQVHSGRTLRRRTNITPEIEGVEYEEVVSIRKYRLEKPIVFDFTTSTKNFVANGIIVHNCDTNVFRPTEDKPACRKWLNEHSQPLDPDHPAEITDSTFLVSMNGANKDPYRKGFPRMMIALQLFLEQNPDAKKDTVYYIHSWMKQSRDLPHGAKILHILEYGRGAPDYHMMTGFPDAGMAMMYGATDVFFHLSEGGGFEQPILEAMSCGIPVNGSDFIGMTELIKDHGWLIPAKTRYMTPLDATAQIDDEFAAASALEDAYNHPDKAKAFGKAGREFALNFDWSIVNPMWIRLFEEIRAERTYRPLEARQL